jgi:carbohydrate-selective porin OprB
MKRSIAVFAVCVLMLGAQAAFGQEDAASAAGINISGGATIILQGTDKAHDGSKKGSIDASYSYDLELSKEFENDSSIFVHIEGALGEGLNSKLSLFSSLNGDSGSTENFLEITEVWYEKALFDKKLSLTFGKLDPAAYFDANEAANDETEQFLAGMFVNNAAVALPDPTLGLRATYAPIEWLEVTYAYFNQNEEWEHIDKNGFNIIEAAYKLSDTGNYRLSYWASARRIEKIKDGERTQDYGIGLSADQAVNENIISKDLAKFVNKEFFNEGDILKSDSETQIELYYKFAVNENIALTPVLQYVSKPLGGVIPDYGTGTQEFVTFDSAFTFGIRTQISF